jgi:uncharacterized membrane protein
MLDFNKRLYARDYRHEAAKQCNKFTGDLIVLFIVEFAVAAIASSAGVGLLVLPHLAIGLIYGMKKVYNDRKPAIEDLFNGFTKDYLKRLLIYVLTGLYTYLWSLLLIIPGIIKSYSYRMASYIHIDRPELSSNECITESRKMMHGHKWELFCLEFSYIGWLFLCALTFGIASLWVAPRMSYSTYLFYLKVSGKGAHKQDAVIIEKESEEPQKTSVNNDDFFADIDSKFN